MTDRLTTHDPTHAEREVTTALDQLGERETEVAANLEADLMDVRDHLYPEDLHGSIAFLTGHGLRELIRDACRAKAWHRVHHALTATEAGLNPTPAEVHQRLVTLCDQLDQEVLGSHRLTTHSDPLEHAITLTQRAMDVECLQEVRRAAGAMGRFRAATARRLAEAEAAGRSLGLHPTTGQPLTVRDYLLLQHSEYQARLQATTATDLITHLRAEGLKYTGQDKATMIAQLVHRRCPSLPPPPDSVAAGSSLPADPPAGPPTLEPTPSTHPHDPPQAHEGRLHGPEGQKMGEVSPSPTDETATPTKAAPSTRAERSAKLAAAAARVEAVNPRA